jgi:hypothetical protein
MRLALFYGLSSGLSRVPSFNRILNEHPQTHDVVRTVSG